MAVKPDKPFVKDLTAYVTAFCETPEALKALADLPRTEAGRALMAVVQGWLTRTANQRRMKPQIADEDLRDNLPWRLAVEETLEQILSLSEWAGDAIKKSMTGGK